MSYSGFKYGPHTAKNNYTYHTYDKSSIKCNLVSCTSPLRKKEYHHSSVLNGQQEGVFSIMGSYNKIKKYLNNPQNIRI